MAVRSVVTMMPVMPVTADPVTVMAVTPHLVAMMSVTADLVAVMAELVQQVDGHRPVNMGTITGVVAAMVIVTAGVHAPWRYRPEPGPGRRAATRAPILDPPAVDGEAAFELAAILARRIAVGAGRRDTAAMAGGRVLPSLGLTRSVELERVLDRLLLTTQIATGQQRIERRPARPHRGGAQRQAGRNRKRHENSFHDTTPVPWAHHAPIQC